MPEEEGHGGGLAEEGDVEALIKSTQSFISVDESERVVHSAVLGDQVVSGCLAIMA